MQSEKPQNGEAARLTVSPNFGWINTQNDFNRRYRPQGRCVWHSEFRTATFGTDDCQTLRGRYRRRGRSTTEYNYDGGNVSVFKGTHHFQVKYNDTI